MRGANLQADGGVLQPGDRRWGLRGHVQLGDGEREGQAGSDADGTGGGRGVSELYFGFEAADGLREDVRGD